MNFSPSRRVRFATEPRVRENPASALATAFGAGFTSHEARRRSPTHFNGHTSGTSVIATP